MSELFWAFMNGPSTWPVMPRRIFLLTLPVSGPLWALAVALTIVGCLAFILSCMVPFWAAKSACVWLASMWSRP